MNCLLHALDKWHAQALIGYDGVTWDRELSDAPPMSLRGIVLSAALGFVGGLGWAVKRAIRRTWRKA